VTVGLVTTYYWVSTAHIILYTMASDVYETNLVQIAQKPFLIGLIGVTWLFDLPFRMYRGLRRNAGQPTKTVWQPALYMLLNLVGFHFATSGFHWFTLFSLSPIELYISLLFFLFIFHDTLWRPITWEYMDQFSGLVEIWVHNCRWLSRYSFLHTLDKCCYS